MLSLKTALRLAALPTTVVVGAMAFALLPGPASPSADPVATPSLPAISVVQAGAGEIADRVRVTGSLVAQRLSVVRAELDGARVTELAVEVGDVVEKGDLLARLDDTMIEIERQRNAAQLGRADAAIDQARSAIEDADAAHERAASALQRARSLSTKGVVSDATLEDKLYDERSTASSLEAARHGLRLARADRDILLGDRHDIETRLARTTVSAPVGGLVLQRKVEVGSLAAQSGSDLFVIAENGTIELEGRVPQADLARIRRGASAEIRVPGYSEAFSGTLRLVEPQLTAEGRMGVVRIALRTDLRLPVGAFARGDVVVGNRTAVLLPSSAIVELDGRSQVFVVEDDVVRPRAVETGLRSGGIVEIVSGVGAGESVVLKSGRFLNAGDRIEPIVTDYDALSSGVISVASEERP
ncbi:efflux RND transporter periplasmic adaptor subunit [Amorphus sp. 3PC139-8]|uniref:efflux RND transporter periplasmic adaptor subunit n=1 Tax=Amorphus sp. 3PC139-8 TaxID=2735676 RepID=UPI00345CA665